MLIFIFSYTATNSGAITTPLPKIIVVVVDRALRQCVGRKSTLGVDFVATS